MKHSYSNWNDDDTLFTVIGIILVVLYFAVKMYSASNTSYDYKPRSTPSYSSSQHKTYPSSGSAGSSYNSNSGKKKRSSSSYSSSSSGKSSSSTTTKTYNRLNCDPADYDSPDDYADDAWGDDFDSWDDAYDFWEDY